MWRRNSVVEIISGESPVCVSWLYFVIITCTFIVAAVLHRSRVSYFPALSATSCLMHSPFKDSGCCSLPSYIVFCVLLQCFVNKHIRSDGNAMKGSAKRRLQGGVRPQRRYFTLEASHPGISSRTSAVPNRLLKSLIFCGLLWKQTGQLQVPGKWAQTEAAHCGALCGLYSCSSVPWWASLSVST